ncbi:unnamed protein product, partial [Citrullus colocynthis]
AQSTSFKVAGIQNPNATPPMGFIAAATPAIQNTTTTASGQNRYSRQSLAGLLPSSLRVSRLYRWGLVASRGPIVCQLLCRRHVLSQSR